MRIIVCGAAGQLGSEITEVLAANKDNEIIAFDKLDMDITVADAVNNKIIDIKPEIIINAAAYTMVDKAESDTVLAFKINTVGAANLASAASLVGAKFCQVSTDYVFDGAKQEPYFEYDVTNPLGVYGRSKLAGEQLVMQRCAESFIVRTAWLYGKNGNNFVKTMLRLGHERKSISVVNDQIGAPTCAADLAEFISELIFSNKYGIYHGTNNGQCSWYDFACAIFAEAGIDVSVNPISTAEYPTPAKRPAYSVLGHEMTIANGFKEMRYWREALNDFLGCFEQ